MLRTKVQSSTKIEIVEKILDQVLEFFRVVHHTGDDSYYLMQISNHYNSELKYIVENVYVLPLSSLPYSLVDWCDARYVNHFYQPIIKTL